MSSLADYERWLYKEYNSRRINAEDFAIANKYLQGFLDSHTTETVQSENINNANSQKELNAKSSISKESYYATPKVMDAPTALQDSPSDNIQNKANSEVRDDQNN